MKQIRPKSRKAVFKPLLPVFMLCLAGLVHAQAPVDGMQLLPTGTFRPLYSNAETSAPTPVRSFWLDTRAVTNREFLAFVTANPPWRRSAVSPLFADETYLQHWGGDLDLGPDAALLRDLPVVNVSWFAARAYAKWNGKRLPTQTEWEFAALASETSPDGRDEPGHYQRILNWYSKPRQAFSAWQAGSFRNVYGVEDLHGLVWEWVEDFNTNLSTGESRADASLDRKFFCGSASIGASDFKDYAAFMRYGFRSSLQATYANPNLGFRCALDHPAQPTFP